MKFDQVIAFRDTKNLYESLFFIFGHFEVSYQKMSKNHIFLMQKGQKRAKIQHIKKVFYIQIFCNPQGYKARYSLIGVIGAKNAKLAPITPSEYQVALTALSALTLR